MDKTIMIEELIQEAETAIEAMENSLKNIGYTDKVRLVNYQFNAGRYYAFMDIL